LLRCHKGGDVFTFVKEYETSPSPTPSAAWPSAPKSRWKWRTLPARSRAATSGQSLQIHEQSPARQNAARQRSLRQIARDYLVQRGVSSDAIKLFRLGYAPDLWDDTVNWPRAKARTPLMEQAGLILSAKAAAAITDRFRGRLMFPICDEQAASSASADASSPATKKTANTSTPWKLDFHQGQVFFGLDKSKRRAARRRLRHRLRRSA